MTTLEHWLSEATEGLSDESAAQVRAEIQQHYDSACEAGDDALGALGDPRAANRAYRKVLLTKWEARMAPSLTRPKRTSLSAMLLLTALWAAFVSWPALGNNHHAPEYWPVRIAIFSDWPLSWFFPLNTLERTRIYLYLHGLRNILVIALAWWYEGWIVAMVLGAVFFSFDYLLTYQRLSIFRKLRNLS